MDALRIDTAAELTLPALAQLFTDGFRHYLLPMNFTAAALAERVCAEHIDLAASRIFWSGNTPSGLALIARRGRVSRLAAMGIIPEARAQGVGRKLVARILEDARARGDARMRLEVFESNAPARALYERSGFSLVRRLIGYEGASIAPMAAPLEELDPARFSQVLPPDDSLPWQLERASLAAPPTGARCFTLEQKAFAYVSGVTGQVAWLRGLFTLPGERRRGHALRLVKALAAHFPEQRVSVPPLLPEGLAAPFFTAAGFGPGALSQLEMAQDLG
ncbi:MAG TPA: GNAT family N-acetyltransferase [Myxococcales bacterium]|jgi:GNAT superfamily N-acetyltransferase|nr:GNAT family N-acetyltransferase [Myxococcales bacterium]